MSTLGRKTPSVAGSRASVYSHASTGRTLRMGSTRTARSMKIPWYKKPLVKNVIYTDLQHGSWHIGFYSLALSAWTVFTSAFDIYCLDQASPGSEHTGYYIISFDFVYVGNPDVRNLLILSSVVSLLLASSLLVTSCILLDGLRREAEVIFRPWLWTMGALTSWKILAWVFGSIVNDMIFPYNIIMCIIWLILNCLNVASWIAIYSLFLELTDLTKIQDLARLKMDTMSSLPASRAASMYGSRPHSPRYGRSSGQELYGESSYGYSVGSGVRQSQPEPVYAQHQGYDTEIL